MIGWYLARGAGVTAMVALTLSVVLGLVSSIPRGPGGTRQDPASVDRRFLRQMAHRSAAVTGLALLGLHVVLLVSDSFVSLSWAGALVPFTAGYRPLALGIGTLAAYALVVGALSGAARGRLARFSPAVRSWRLVHLLAFGGWALCVAHAVTAGTDSGQTWFLAVVVCCVLGVGTTLAVRLILGGRRARTGPPTRHALTTTSGAWTR